jgi:hypothetical protein
MSLNTLKYSFRSVVISWNVSGPTPLQAKLFAPYFSGSFIGGKWESHLTREEACYGHVLIFEYTGNLLLVELDLRRRGIDCCLRRSVGKSQLAYFLHSQDWASWMGRWMGKKEGTLSRRGLCRGWRPRYCQEKYIVPLFSVEIFPISGRNLILGNVYKVLLFLPTGSCLSRHDLKRVVSTHLYVLKK